MDLNGGFNDILKEGKSLFFPNGVSSKGHESDFTFHVWDFKQNSFSDVSIGTIYDAVKLPKLRFYIATQPKPQSVKDASTTESEHKDDDSCFEDEVIEVSDSQSLSLVSSYSDQDQDQDQVSLHHPVATDRSIATNHPDITDDGQVVSEIHFLLPEILQEDAVVLQDYVTLGDNPYIPDPEITFGPHTEAGEFDQDDTGVSA